MRRPGSRAVGRGGEGGGSSRCWRGLRRDKLSALRVVEDEHTLSVILIQEVDDRVPATARASVEQERDRVGIARSSWETCTTSSPCRAATGRSLNLPAKKKSHMDASSIFILLMRSCLNMSGRCSKRATSQSTRPSATIWRETDRVKQRHSACGGGGGPTTHPPESEKKQEEKRKR